MRSRDVKKKVRFGFVLHETPRACAALVAAALLTGCSRAPSFSILGSFFPAWLVCIIAGMLLSVVTYRVLVRFNLDKEIIWSIVVYPSIALFFACVLWLIFFS
jgi:hypothetical protein